MADNLQHILATSAMIIDVETAISSGRLPEDLEMLLREAAARTRIAFKLGLPGEKSWNDNTSLADLDRVNAAVAIEIQS